LRPSILYGLVDPSIKRSRAGLRVVAISLALLAITAAIQAAIYVATDSIALLADLVHNAGDAPTAVPLGVAFLLRSQRAERGAGLAVVLTILASAITAGLFAVERIINPLPPENQLVSVGVILSALAVALGAAIADPIIGLVITALILRIRWQSWNTVRDH